MTRSRTTLPGAVAAALLAAAALVGLSGAPAGAAYCSGGGVNVVVDFQGLGGGVQKACDPDGANESADRVFPHAGFALSYAQRQPGFVCRVNGAPSSDPCVNTPPSNAFWGLYWSDGTSGTWTFASTGVSGLKVPSGGFVAFSWQNGGDADPPGAAPTNQTNQTKPPAPTPTRTPSKAPAPSKPPGPGKSPRPTSGSGGSAAGGSASTSASAAASRSAEVRPGGASPSRSASASPSAAGASASGAPSASTTPTADPAGEENASAGDQPRLTTTSGGGTGTQEADGLPAWVPGAGVVGLMAAAGGVAWWRRRGLGG